MSKGKHRTTTRTARYVATTSLGLTGLALTPGIAHAAPQEAWDQVVQCESGGQNVESASPASSASGYFQIIDSTWAAYGGLEYAPRAIDATYEQQLAVAERILAGQGPSAWVNGCGDALIGQASDPAPTEEIPAVTGTEYVVQAGDTLVRVFGADWERIAQLNGIVSPFVVHPGQVLITEPPVYVVQPGDTLSEIAAAHDVCLDDLFEDNRDVVEDVDLIYPGEELVVRMTTLPEVPPPASQQAAPVVAAQAGYAHPLAGHAITSYWRADRPDHRGVDIDGSQGDQFVAAADGIVRESRCGVSGFGCWIVIDHLDEYGGRFSTVYGHMYGEGLLVSAGQTVIAGQPIGLVGNNGAVSSGGGGDGSHLHFEVWQGGRIDGGYDIDPVTWLQNHGVA